MRILESVVFMSLINLLVGSKAYRLFPTAAIRRRSATVYSARDDRAEMGHQRQQLDSWMNQGLLISSFSDGLRPNVQAQDCLRRGIIRAMLTQEQIQAESKVEASVKYSPCAGPDLSAIDRMEYIDSALAELQHHLDPIQLVPPNESQIRFVYIPTAMYALRPDSNNSPGKQRQRARADGKKRRNEIVKLLQHLFKDSMSTVAVVTLDLDDGSIKQLEGTDDQLVFPSTGKEALQGWNPHLVYVEGGNTFWLYHCMQKGAWRDDLVMLCTGPNKTFYCGSSAGAILVGASVETASWKGWDDPSIIPEMEEYDDWIGIKGLELVGTNSFFPHMGNEWSPLVKEKREEIKSDVLCLYDEDACYVDGNSKSITILSSPIRVMCPQEVN